MTDRPSPTGSDGRSFGSVADVYDRGRPSYTRDAVAWATSAEPLTVLELGAGTGKLTEQLVALGHDVHATDPDAAMLDLLRARLPEVRTSVTGAEEIPATGRSYDVVIAAQAFHWFDHERALPEIARVLKPGGHLAVVFNSRDERIPWVKKLGRIIASPPPEQGSLAVLVSAQDFDQPTTESFKNWQTVDRRTIQDLVASRSDVISLGEEERAAKLAEVLALYDDYGRGMDGMQLPYLTRCLRAQVVDRPDAPGLDLERRDGAGDSRNEPTMPIRPIPPIPPPTDDDSGMLLIDFR
ncbi:putative methyltransferase [Nocardioides psychrotolerans]|uniref:Ubiquinone/menaquinone biosynthesis C-methylase UbiE n=1 Tax=Nocardioides psychrotolerans TaxID=1005945 RepID=A0A1I3DU99_9ACTN|nr:class I SAM-dependent methyltransferase [Nocardioides psychrotolerans]GEP39240.1 putative methyltransferase [Nocardioides psychrotolerans]SFH90168.1 Ubiquinone/menaquinone biosynthesis C-methylase UbiE [Nocardioides psychrotolerans]